MSPFRGTQQVCARIRQGCERLACHPARMRRGAPRSAHPGAKVPPKDRIYIDGPDRPRCGLKEAAGQDAAPMPATARAPKNPILWRDFCMASRANAPPSGFFRVPSALFPAGRGAGPSGLPAGAPEGGPACRGAKYKTMHVMHKTAFSNEGMRGGEKSASFDAQEPSLPSLYLEKVEHHETTTRRYAERQIPTAHPLSIPSKL